MAYPCGAFTIMENNISEGNRFGLDMNARFGNSESNTVLWQYRHKDYLRILAHRGVR